jgi:hypothetical protein
MKLVITLRQCNDQNNKSDAVSELQATVSLSSAGFK